VADEDGRVERLVISFDYVREEMGQRQWLQEQVACRLGPSPAPNLQLKPTQPSTLTTP